MTIDEAIENEKELSEHCKRMFEEMSAEDKLANKLLKSEIQYHEQLAEWLEELKKRRSEDYGYMADIHQSIGYRQAIDDFVKALRIEYSPVSDEMQNEYDNVCLRFEKIAEQLKVGEAK